MANDGVDWRYEWLYRTARALVDTDNYVTRLKDHSVQQRRHGMMRQLQAALPLTGVWAYYTETLAKTPKIRWPGVRVRLKI